MGVLHHRVLPRFSGPHRTPRLLATGLWKTTVQLRLTTTCSDSLSDHPWLGLQAPTTGHCLRKSGVYSKYCFSSFLSNGTTQMSLEDLRKAISFKSVFLKIHSFKLNFDFRSSLTWFNILGVAVVTLSASFKMSLVQILLETARKSGRGIIQGTRS